MTYQSIIKTYMQKQQHHTQAITLSLLSYAFIIGILFLIHIQTSVAHVQTTDNGIEINLGNADEGEGDIAPAVVGAPAALTEASTASVPARSTTQEKETVEASYKPVVPNQNKEAVAIKTHSTPRGIKKEKAPEKKLPIAQTAHQPNKTTHTTEPANNVPSSPTPKAIYKGGKGTGGNYADSYNNVSNQGIAGGRGDQGKANGNPQSDSYTGNSNKTSTGISIQEGLAGRHIAKYPSFTSQFNQNAKVAIKIVVNENGEVTSASINPRGTTTTNAQIKRIALEKAKQLKLNKGKQQSGTIVFNFKLNG